MDAQLQNPQASHRSFSLLIFLERAVVLVLWLLLGMNFFYPWEGWISSDSGGGTQEFATSHIILLMIYAATALLFFTRPVVITKTLFRAWPILLLTAWIFLSVTWSVDPVNSAARATRFLTLVIFSCYVASRYSQAEFVRLFTTGFLITVVGSFAVMILVPRLAHSNLDGGYESAWRGGFIHKNWLGAAMSLGLFMSAYSFIIRANSRLVSGFTFLGCALLLLLSWSASAMVSTFLALMLLALGAAIQAVRVPVLRGLGIGIVIVATILVILSPIVLANIDITQLPGLIGRSATLTGRTGIWHAVLEAAEARPLLGYGYGFWDELSTTRANIWLEVDWQAPHAHNTWLDAFLQVGLVGVFFTVLAWIIPIGRSMWSVVVRDGNGALFFLAILSSSLVRSAVETVMFMPALQALFWVVTSFIYTSQFAHQRLPRTAKVDTAGNERPARLTGLTAAREANA